MKINEYIFKEKEVICTDKYLNLCNLYTITKVKYYKHDFLFQDGIWRDEYVKSCINTKSNIVVVGHSDFCVDDTVAMKIKEQTNCKKLYSVNNISTFDWCFPLPLGITNLTNETSNHPIYGNTSIMKVASEQNIKKSGLVYCNVNIYTNVNKRKDCVLHFMNKDWVTMGQHQSNINSRYNFLLEIKRHKFVICPEGNGIDTHRLWETLYMGSIPIVQKTIALRGFDDLPIAWIDDWKQVTKEWCEKMYEEMIDKEWNMEKLNSSYWTKVLKDEIN